MDFPKRKIYDNAVIVVLPEELGYACPYNEKHNITFSEYEGHIWCYDCEKDFPSCFCKDNIEDNMKIFYDTVSYLNKTNYANKTL